MLRDRVTVRDRGRVRGRTDNRICVSPGWTDNSTYPFCTDNNTNRPCGVESVKWLSLCIIIIIIIIMVSLIIIIGRPVVDAQGWPCALISDRDAHGRPIVQTCTWFSIVIVSSHGY